VTTDVWILTHVDLVNVARIRAFVDHVSGASRAHRGMEQ